MRVEYNINKVQDTSYPLAQYGLLDVHSPVAPGLTVEYSEDGVPWCKVKMTIPQHPSRSLWQPIEIDVVGHHLADTFEAAALEAINIFCDQHPDGEVLGVFGVHVRPLEVADEDLLKLRPATDAVGW
jgi:hypothetical protein